MNELTPLQKLERDALLMDRRAVLGVVSALRGYRAICAKLGGVYGEEAARLLAEAQALESGPG